MDRERAKQVLIESVERFSPLTDEVLEALDILRSELKAA